MQRRHNFRAPWILFPTADGLEYTASPSHDSHVQRNGQSVDEPYLPPGAADDREVMEPVRLPPDCYFLLGDNRSNSMDSREYGCVPGSFLIGKVMLQPTAAKNHR